jgi:hypothetical protein
MSRTRSTTANRCNGTILAAGIALCTGAVAFLAVFSYLAARFHYPEVLDGEARNVLPALLGMGERGRAVWAIYGVLPLVFLPAGVGAFHALRRHAEGPTRLGMYFAMSAALCMMLGLLRWPSVHWALATAWMTAGPGERVALAASFDGLNSYLGNFVGEFLGELSFSAFFTLAGVGLLRHRRTTRGMGWWGVTTGVLGFVGMWRNVTPAVNAVAEVNNYLLPAWMIGFGVWLMREGCRAGDD